MKDNEDQLARLFVNFAKFYRKLETQLIARQLVIDKLQSQYPQFNFRASLSTAMTDPQVTGAMEGKFEPAINRFLADYKTKGAIQAAVEMFGSIAPGYTVQ